MSRKRNRNFAETRFSPEFHRVFMEFPGSASRADDDFLELEADEELLCSVSDITEHLGRNISVVLETALSEIRKMVSIRIRFLKMELREKTEEIELLKSKLDVVQRNGKDPFSGLAAVEPPADSGFKKHDFSSGSKPHNTDPKRTKAVVPGVKKENIDAICDHLMKDKNSKGCVDIEGDQVSLVSGEKEYSEEPEPHPLNLWPDSGMTVSGPVHGDPDGTAEDIFSMNMLPSGSKRMYDYEWMAPYSSDLKEESRPTVCLITPLQAPLVQNTKDSMGDSPVVQEVKRHQWGPEQETDALLTVSAVDPRFKDLPFLSEEERAEMYGRLIVEAASLLKEKILRTHNALKKSAQPRGRAAARPSF